MNDKQPRKISTIMNQNKSEIEFQDQFDENKHNQKPIKLPRMWKQEEDYLGISINSIKYYSNSMKFPKPRKMQPNQYEPEEIQTDLQIIQRLCQKLDGTWNCPEYTEFMQQAYNEVRGMKAAKIKKKNTIAQKRREIQQKELEENLPYSDYSEINNINMATTQIGELPLIEIIVNNKRILALLDTGSTNSLINVGLAQELQLPFIAKRRTISTSNGSSQDNCIGQTSNSKVDIQTEEDGTVSILINFLVCHYINGYPALIGTDVIFYSELNSQIDQDYWKIQPNNMENNEYVKIPLTMTIKGDIPLIATRTAEEKPVKKVRFYLPEDSDVIEGTKVLASAMDKQEEFFNQTALVHNNIISGCKYLEISINEAKCSLSQINVCRISTTKTEKIQMVDDYITNPGKLDKNIKFKIDKNLPEESQDEVAPFFAENDLTEKMQTTVAEFDESIPFTIKKYAISDIELSHLPSTWQQKFGKLLNSYPKLFSRSEYDIGCATNMEVDLEIMNIPPSQSQRFLDHNKLKFTQKTIDELEKADVVQIESEPLVVQNLVLVPKYKNANKSNSKAERLHHQLQQSRIRAYRICLDLRAVNSQTCNVERTSAVLIQDFIAQLKSKIVTSFDLTQAYFSIPLTRRAQRLTAFYLGDKIYSFKRLSMGLLSACESFCKFMKEVTSQQVYDEIFEDLSEEERRLLPKSFQEFFTHYFDDIFIFATDLATHLVCVKVTMEAFLRAGLKISPSKSKVAVKKFPILGYRLDTTTDKIKLDQEKSQGVLRWPRPNSLYELHSRIAMISYWQRNLPGLKHILYPLIHMMRKKEFNWTKIHEESWIETKKLVQLSMETYIPDKTQQLFLFTDASKLACSQVLMTMEDKNLHVVAVNSRLFSSADLGKSAFTKESLSLALGIKNFSSYLFASEKPAKIFTDCKSLIFVGQKCFYRLAEYNISAFLAYYSKLLDFRIYHIPGQFNLFADLFSRQIANNKVKAIEIAQNHFGEKELPEYFKIDADTFFEFLTTPGENFHLKSRNEKSPANRTLTPAKLVDLYNGNSPEIRWLSKSDLQSARIEGQLDQRNQQMIDRHKAKSKINIIMNTECQDEIESSKIYPFTSNPEEEDDQNDGNSKINFKEEIGNLTHDLAIFQHGSLYNSVPRQVFSQLQDHDEYLASLKCAGNCPNFEIIDGIIYKIEKGRRLICIPDFLLQNIIELLHRKLGHVSYEKLFEYFRSHYFNKNASTKIKKIIHSCLICNIYNIQKDIKIKTGRKRSYQPSRPRQGISLDLITNLPPNKDRITTMILIMDLFSKYCMVYFAGSKAQIEVKKAIYSYFSNFGVPEFVFSDSDRSLIAPLQTLGKTFKFKYLTSTAYAQFQNSCERQWQELKNLVKKIIYDPVLIESDTRELWPYAVILGLQSLNALKLRGCDFSREEIFFRFQNESILFLSDELLPNTDQIDEIILKNVQNYMTTAKKKDNGIDPETFCYKKGQVVYLKRPPKPGVNQMFLETKIGPFSVVKIDKQGYEIQLKHLETNKTFFTHPKYIHRINDPYELVNILQDLRWDSNFSKFPQ